MTSVVIYKDRDERITGFNMIGHAGAGEAGNDLVCCACSMLCFNTINSIEAFTGEEMKLVMNEEAGLVDMVLKESPSKESELLLKSFELGIKGLVNEYGSYINLKYREV